MLPKVSMGYCVGCGVFEEELAEGLCFGCWDKSTPSLATQKYRNSSPGKAYVSHYNKSPAAKAAREKYRKSEKGKKTSQKYYHSEKFAVRKRKIAAARQFAELEAMGLCGLCGQPGHEAEAHVVGRENGV